MKPLYKILLVIGILVLAGLLIYFVWRFLTIDSSEINLENPPSLTDGLPTLPGGNGDIGRVGENGDNLLNGGDAQGLNTQKFKKISDGYAFHYWIAPGTGEIYYMTPEGHVFSVKDGPDLEISTQPIEALNSAETSPQEEKILVSFGDPQKPQWGLFDVVDKVWRPLPQNITYAVWGIEDKELIALIRKDNNLNLVRLDLTKTPPTTKVLLEDFRFHDVRFTVISQDEFIIYELPNSIYKGRIWKFDMKNLTLNLLNASEYGRMTTWSPDHVTTFQFFTPNRFRISEGDTLKTLVPFPHTTFPNKCTAIYNDGASNIYCFVPKNIDFLEPRAQYPDDYLQRKIYSQDDLYIINTSEEDFSQIQLPSSQTIDGVSLLFSQDTLYFINRYDTQLYSLRIE